MFLFYRKTAQDTFGETEMKWNEIGWHVVLSAKSNHRHDRYRVNWEIYWKSIPYSVSLLFIACLWCSTVSKLYCLLRLIHFQKKENRKSQSSSSSLLITKSRCDNQTGPITHPINGNTCSCESSSIKSLVKRPKVNFHWSIRFSDTSEYIREKRKTNWRKQERKNKPPITAANISSCVSIVHWTAPIT